MRAPSISAVTLAPHRIAAMVRRYVYLLRSSWTRLLELIYWPSVQLFVWGFLQLYIAQNSGFFARASGVFIAAVAEMRKAIETAEAALTPPAPRTSP